MVIAAVDESVDATKCQGKGDCQGGTRCLTHTLWRDLSSRISSFLNDITLGELMQDNEVKQIAGRQDSSLESTTIVRHGLNSSGSERPATNVSVNIRS